MTIGGALSELNNLLIADDIPVYYKPSIKAVMDTIALSSSENPSRWIPVSERLPDKLKDVLIAFADAPDEYEIAYLKATDNATYKENGAVNEWMTFAGTNYADYEVEAWMPIPPYQPEIPTGAESEG